MIAKAIHKLAFILMLLAAVSLTLMMIQTTVDVVLDNLFGAPIEGNLEIISAYHMVLVVFLPLAYVELRHEHISADLLVRILPRTLQRGIYVFGGLVSCFFFGVLAWQTALDAIDSYQIDEVIMGSVYVTIWPAKMSLPIGFTAILLAVLHNMWRAVTEADFDPAPESPDVDIV
ncbi:TRAP transporter small permease [uncultured Castellaniella sp.]|uniref:TRAP transporter small permease n=1 Tax=uncultured Castellaniella sp. TaxID=647907 RepID=UPI00261C969F|nr:TRAP transporter small permease [uncultured Castellaniella sp.]